ITPAVIGTSGSGRGHKFSTGQVLGLAVVGAMLASPRGCCNECTRAVVAHFGDMSPAYLDGRLGEDSPEVDAAEAAFFNHPLFAPSGKPLSPGHEAIMADIRDRIGRVLDAVRERLGRDGRGGRRPTARMQE